MHRKIHLVGNKSVTISSLLLVVFGSLMVISAEMGNAGGDTAYLTSVIRKQVIIAALGILSYFVFMNLKISKMKPFFINICYYILLGALFVCRLFGQTNGAYAWIRIGGFSLQPSEFCKVFMIVYGARLFGKDLGKKNIDNLKRFAIHAAIYFGMIFIYQSDLGSAIVLAVICYCIVMIPPYIEFRKIQRYMTFIIFGAIALMFVVFSSPFTDFLKGHADNYMVGRFLAAADPFLYRYDNGYHVIMALVSFANGGLFGLGYGNSIHKYMNFPNPSNDFILPIIVEELGIVGFVAFIIAYGFMLFPLIRCSFKTKYFSSKTILLGVFVYFATHFILNIGGVSAIIPLTGVPLLLISSGGSSLLASMMGLGIAQSELIRNRNVDNESNSGEV